MYTSKEQLLRQNTLESKSSSTKPRSETSRARKRGINWTFRRGKPRNNRTENLPSDNRGNTPKWSDDKTIPSQTRFKSTGDEREDSDEEDTVSISSEDVQIEKVERVEYCKGMCKVHCPISKNNQQPMWQTNRELIECDKVAGVPSCCINVTMSPVTDMVHTTILPTLGEEAVEMSTRHSGGSEDCDDEMKSSVLLKNGVHNYDKVTGDNNVGEEMGELIGNTCMNGVNQDDDRTRTTKIEQNNINKNISAHKQILG